jgi:hypothetical protein
VLNLQAVSHHTLKQFALRLRHEIRLLRSFGLHKPQPPNQTARGSAGYRGARACLEPVRKYRKLRKAQKNMAGAAGLEPSGQDPCNLLNRCYLGGSYQKRKMEKTHIFARLREKLVGKW